MYTELLTALGWLFVVCVCVGVPWWIWRNRERLR